jgi:hypothetical protein
MRIDAEGMSSGTSYECPSIFASRYYRKQHKTRCVLNVVHIDSAESLPEKSEH